MAIPSNPPDDNGHQMHLIIRSDISTLDETQVPLDVFFEAVLDIEQVRLRKFLIPSKFDRVAILMLNFSTTHALVQIITIAVVRIYAYKINLKIVMIIYAQKSCYQVQVRITQIFSPRSYITHI